MSEQQQDNGAVIAVIREQFAHAGIEVSEQFVGARMADSAFVAPESDLVDLSSHFSTDVMWLSFQSTVDAFQFHHWRAGLRVRNFGLWLLSGGTDMGARRGTVGTVGTRRSF
jgi:hypothetical protein